MKKRFELKKGLDLPISGVPAPTLEDGPVIRTVALVADDYVGMKPTMEVGEGDLVKLGQLLFTDKKTLGVNYTSPGCGTVVSIHRGAKRKFESIVIELAGDDAVSFEPLSDFNFSQLERRRVRDHLVVSGLWTSLRMRPYGRVPDPNSVPDALFITAIDTNPLAASPTLVLNGKDREFISGMQVLTTLTDGPTYLCKAMGASIPGTDESCVSVVEFSGPHPAGLPGTHIHFLAPVSEDRTAWHIGYQDVVAIGHLFLTGQLSVDRVISLGGPAAKRPRLVRTRLGASLPELTVGETNASDEGIRTISGSVLSGRTGAAPRDYLGRYHLQVSLLKEGRQRELFGWALPGPNKFSIKPVFVSALANGFRRQFPFTTSTGGSRRAIIPIGSYEQVMPLDIIATPLLKALVSQDSQYAKSLGCLELDEEDLALCTFVCPGKYDYGPVLRNTLTRIEQEG